jgi:hypothetical protein
MKTIPSKLWSVASGNQTVSGGGGETAAAYGTKTKVSPTSSGDTINVRDKLSLSYKMKNKEKFLILALHPRG